MPKQSKAKQPQKPEEPSKEDVLKAMQAQKAAQDANVPGMGNLSGVELLQKMHRMQEELGTKQGMKRTAGDILKERELKILNEYSVKVVQKFGRYIKSVVAFGSTKRGKNSDIDVAVIVDDTDVTRMTRGQLKDKLFQRLIEVAYVTDKKIHPQPYLLTEFWEYIRHGNPVMYTVMRTGIPLYDTGFFLPVQLIFKQGLITPSSEAIDRHILMSVELLRLTEDMLNRKLIYNMEQSIVAAGQAVLMERGYRPPAPREIADFLEKLVGEKLFAQKYADIAREIVDVYKQTEHGTLKEIKGKAIDDYLAKTTDFVKKMEDVLSKERKKKGETYKFKIAEDKEKEESKKVKREGLIDVERKPVAETADESQKIIEEGLAQR
ncbi:hypothetical protein COT72_01180 [archaeon CG10_big_fil_rev_8_21_14_0_10_43_11]|nr:MAG: hypothetical protein COT72_01180 [archaeon CG10_big_fil_rev_8_21_14_0_10_43_11]